MKKIYLIIISTLIIGCVNNKEETKNMFFISGELQNTETAILYKLSTNKIVPIDTAIVKNGKFNLSGHYNQPDFYRINFSNGNAIRLFLDTSATIILNADAEDIINYSLSGSDPSIKLMELDKMVLQSFEKLDSVSDYLDNLRINAKINSIELRTLFINEYSATTGILKNKMNKFIKANANSPISIIALFQTLGNQTIFNPKNDIDLFRLVEQKLDDNFKTLDFSKYLSSEIKRSNAGRIGSKAPDFTFKTPEGKSISISDYKNKLLLIDFWASWCAPCRKENPNLVKLYNEFNPKGLEILGVSLDGTKRQKNPKKDWENAIKTDGLIWDQVSDLRGWESAVTDLYGFNGIPHTVLIDKEGTIIATKLRGTALENELKKLLN